MVLQPASGTRASGPFAPRLGLGLGFAFAFALAFALRAHTRAHAQFDCFSHSTVHWSMACVFIVCVALSAIFQTGQVWSLHKDHPHRKSLWRNSLWKCLFVTVAVLGAIAFAACYGVVSVCSPSSSPSPR